MVVDDAHEKKLPLEERVFLPLICLSSQLIFMNLRRY